MKANRKLWFRIAGVCCAVGVVLMVSALFLVKFDIYKLSSPVPFGVSIVRETPADLPGAPAAPAAPVAPANPAAPAFPASFDFADKASLGWRALDAVVETLGGVSQ